MSRPKTDSDSEKEIKNSNITSVGKSDIACDMSGKLDTLISAVIELMTSQEGMKRMFESKIDKFRSDIMENVDCKMCSLGDELFMDIGRETSRTDQMLTTIQSIQIRLDSLDQTRTEVSTSQANEYGSRTDMTLH